MTPWTSLACLCGHTIVRHREEYGHANLGCSVWGCDCEAFEYSVELNFEVD